MAKKKKKAKAAKKAKSTGKTKFVDVPGSKKAPMKGAEIIGPAPDDERVEVTIRLRPRNEMPDPSELLAAGSKPIKQLTHTDYDKKYGASAADVAKIRKFAKDHSLTVVRESLPRRSVMLSGKVADLKKAFDVSLHIYEHPEGTYRGRTGFVKVPSSVAPVIEGVFGLDNRPVAKPHFRMNRNQSAHAAAKHAFDPNQVAKLYNFPPGVDGTGQCIAIIELGGGYKPQEVKAYFQGLGLSKIPSVIPVSVDNAKNVPIGSSDSADGEVVLDIEVAGAVAPGAKIAVYFAPNDATAKGFLDALTKAIHDTVNNPSVISISWGGMETETQTNSFQRQFDKALQAAAMLGITVCVASGDDGAADDGPKEWDGKPHVDFPASSPFALACGGTALIEHQGAIQSESVWNQHRADIPPAVQFPGSFGSGGGGVSLAFPLPDYQLQASVPSAGPSGFKGRGVPDVSGAGDPETGYNVICDGDSFPIGGTSAVAPLWAGLIACINQKLGRRVGFINPHIYSLPAGSNAFHDIVSGNNRVTFQQHHNIGFDAGPGWDAATGLGSPDGDVLAATFASTSHSGPSSGGGPPKSKPPKKKKSAKRKKTKRKDQRRKKKKSK